MFAFASLTLVIFLALLCGAMIILKINVKNDKTVETAPDTVEIKIIVFIIVHHTSATVSPS